MAVTLTTRTNLDLDPALFPRGVEPGSLIQMHGASGSGKTFLITYLLARFVNNYPTKRAVLIDTRGQFSVTAFSEVLANLGRAPQPSSDAGAESHEPTQGIHSQLLKDLDRVLLIQCLTPEDLLFCFGPKNAGMLEKMLLVSPDISLVVVDSLDSFTYCPSLPKISPTESPDLVKLLKRSVEPTKTPVICVMSDYYGNYPKQPHSPEDADEKLRFLAPQAEGLFRNLNFDKSKLFSHSLFLQRSQPVGGTQAEAEFGEKQRGTNNKENPVFTAHLRSRNNPNIALSGASHRVKFSILSGMLNWCRGKD